MRKKILLTAIPLVAIITASAQLEKGKLYGDIQLGKRITRYSTWNVQPGISLALNKRLALGIFYDYTQFEKYANTYSSGYGNRHTTGISLDYFHYFGKSQKWGWYVNSTLGYFMYKGYDKASGSSIVTNYHVKASELNITPGIFFKPSGNLLIFANTGGISLTKYRFGSSYNLDFGTQVNIGVKINLGKGKKK